MEEKHELRENINIYEYKIENKSTTYKDKKSDSLRDRKRKHIENDKIFYNTEKVEIIPNNTKDFYGHEIINDENTKNFRNDFIFGDPLLTTFDIKILDNSPLFNKNGLKSFLIDYSSIKDIKNLIKLYDEFIKKIIEIFNIKGTKYHYINKIDGLDKFKQKFIKYRDDNISFLLYENVKMEMFYISELYNNLYYSYKNQRINAPENLFRFNMEIDISEVRNFKYGKNRTKSKYTVRLYDCNFVFFDSRLTSDHIVRGGFTAGKPTDFSEIGFFVYYKSAERILDAKLMGKRLLLDNKLSDFKLINEKISRNNDNIDIDNIDNINNNKNKENISSFSNIDFKIKNKTENLKSNLKWFGWSKVGKTKDGNATFNLNHIVKTFSRTIVGNEIVNLTESIINDKTSLNRLFENWAKRKILESERIAYLSLINSEKYKNIKDKFQFKNEYGDDIYDMYYFLINKNNNNNNYNFESGSTIDMKNDTSGVGLNGQNVYVKEESNDIEPNEPDGNVYDNYFKGLPDEPFVIEPNEPIVIEPNEPDGTIYENGESNDIEPNKPLQNYSYSGLKKQNLKQPNGTIYENGESNDIEPNEPDGVVYDETEDINPNEPDGVVYDETEDIKPNKPDGVVYDETEDINPNEPDGVVYDETDNIKPNEPDGIVYDETENINPNEPDGIIYDETENIKPNKPGGTIYNESNNIKPNKPGGTIYNESNNIKPNEPDGIVYDETENIKPNEPDGVVYDETEDINPNKPDGIIYDETDNIKPNKPDGIIYDETENIKPNKPGGTIYENDEINIKSNELNDNNVYKLNNEFDKINYKTNILNDDKIYKSAKIKGGKFVYFKLNENKID